MTAPGGELEAAGVHREGVREFVLFVNLGGSFVQASGSDASTVSTAPRGEKRRRSPAPQPSGAGDGDGSATGADGGSGGSAIIIPAALALMGDSFGGADGGGAGSASVGAVRARASI